MWSKLKTMLLLTVCAIVCSSATVLSVNAVRVWAVNRNAESIGSPDPNTPRPIAAQDTVFLEEMTWMEVRDALQAGKDTVLVATGGVEQAGPYLAMGKHNYICRATTEAIARKLENTLVAPVIPFVPEGDLDPPAGHMKYAGTLSLTEVTYRALLREICACYRVHGFSQILLIGDSYENQEGMKAVAEQLDAQWAGGRARVFYIPEYYNQQATSRWLAEQGIRQEPEWLHDDFVTTATLMTVNPALVRTRERLAAGRFQINGIDLTPVANTIAWGRKIVDYRATLTVNAIRQRLARERPDGTRP
jgi:creatinine amidohydrolase